MTTCRRRVRSCCACTPSPDICRPDSRSWTRSVNIVFTLPVFFTGASNPIGLWIPVYYTRILGRCISRHNIMVRCFFILLFYFSKPVPGRGSDYCNLQYIISMIPKNNDHNLLYQFRQIVLYFFQRSTQHFQFIFFSAGFLFLLGQL